MYVTRNKKESSRLISELSLNQFPIIHLESFDAKRINAFLEKYPADYYAVRDLSKSNSKKFNLKVPKCDIIEYTKSMTRFSINVSSYNYTNNQLCTGELRIGSDDSMSVTISNNKSFSARDAVYNPDYNFVSDIYDPRLKLIDGLSSIINYIYIHSLFDIIVEFSVFDTNVGINSEDVVIYELRTNY